MSNLSRERELRIREEAQQRAGLQRLRERERAKTTATSSAMSSQAATQSSPETPKRPAAVLQPGGPSSAFTDYTKSEGRPPTATGPATSPMSQQSRSYGGMSSPLSKRSVSMSARLSMAGSAKSGGGESMPDYPNRWQNIAHLLHDYHSEAEEEVAGERLADTAARAEQQNASSWHHPVDAAKVSQDSGTGTVRGRKSARSATGGLFKRFFSPPRKSRHSNTNGSDQGGRSPSTVVASPPIESRGSYIVAEPTSFIDSGTPGAIPEGEDPLAYMSNPERLLDEADMEEEILQREDQKRKLALQDENIALARAGGGSIGGKVFLAAHRARLWTRSKILALCGVRTGDGSEWHTVVLTNLQRGVLKCVTAYFLASLCTFSPYLSSHLAMLLPNHDPDKKVPISNLHMIATVAVYFHPAKTIGAMLEADMYAVIGWVYSIALSAISMASAVYLHDQHLEILSNVLIVVLFLGCGMGFVAWSKVKMGSPSFNTACSMIGIIVFTVMVKEGAAHLGKFSIDKIMQVTICVITGTLVSNFICFALWPQSATTNLQVDIRRNLTGFSTLLKVLTKTFLLDDPSQFYIDSERIKRAIEDHHTSFTSLKKNLREARLERAFDSRIRGATAKYNKVTDSMNRLAQHLAGLRSSCGLQHRIMTKQKDMQREGSLLAAKGQYEDVAERDEDPNPFSDNNEVGGDENWEVRVNAFGDFVQFIGPHMRSLVVSLSRSANA